VEELPLDVAPLVGNKPIEDAAIAFVIRRGYISFAISSTPGKTWWAA
jgi:hypothetical protein